MPGAGTKPDITTNSPPPARVLDLTRLISRAGRVLTGVDRVELAYLNWLLSMETTCFGLVKTRLGYVLLGREGLAGLRDRFEGSQAWGRPDFLSFFFRRQHVMRRRAEADLRRLMLARCLPRFLSRMLEKHVPKASVYLNVGHSNLTESVIAAFHSGLKAQISVLVHDTIPLDFPQYQRPNTVEQFRAFLQRVSRSADLVICNSEVTRRDVHRNMENWGRVPKTIVSHLGTILPVADVRQLPDDMGLRPPYFLSIGTIEPRKNHAFLLNLWEEMAQDLPAHEIPQLLICGSRGWNNDAVFRRLDDVAGPGKNVVELSGLSDAAIAALLQNASGVLFPSFVEGFGLPAVEATAAETPVICNDLPVFREILHDIPIYAPVSDSYPWKTKIIGLARKKKLGRDTDDEDTKHFDLPTWSAHFNTVLKVS